MLRKTFRIDYSNGINEIVDKSLVPEKFATVLDNVDIRSSFAEGFKEPIFYKAVSPVTTKKIFKYRGRWIYSDEHRDYVYQFVEDQERVFWTSEKTRPKKQINGSDPVPLGTAKPKSSVTVGFNEPLRAETIELKPIMSSGSIKAGLYKYRVAALTDGGWQHPSDEYGYNLLEEGGIDVNFDEVRGAKRYSIFRDSGDGFEKIGDSETNSFSDLGTIKKDSNLFDDIASQLDKADHTYVYSYERDVNGMVDESGLSPISNSFNTTNERVVVRNVLSDGYFDQDGAESINTGLVVYKTSEYNPKITITGMDYIEKIKHVQFTTSTPHKLKTDDLIIFSGTGWSNPYYYKKQYKVIVISPTLFNIADLQAPTDFNDLGNVKDGCFIQICRTRIALPSGTGQNLYDGDAAYIYAKDNTTEGLSNPEILNTRNTSQVYIPNGPTLTQEDVNGAFTANTMYRYKVVAVSEYGEMSQASNDIVITPNTGKSVKVTLPNAPTSGFSDFSHWLLFRETAPYSYKYFQNLKGDGDSDTSWTTTAKFDAGEVYIDKNTESHWSKVETDIKVLESTVNLTYINVNDVRTWSDESLSSYMNLSFNGNAKTDSSGRIVNIANIGTITFDEFLEPTEPFNTYSIKIVYKYNDFVNGTYGPTFVAFEYSMNDGKDWTVFATDDFESSKKYLTDKRTIELDIYNELAPVSPSNIKIRARIALTNISESNAAGNNNRTNSYIFFKNLVNSGPFSYKFSKYLSTSGYERTISDINDTNQDFDVDSEAETQTSAGPISTLKAIKPIVQNTPFDTTPLEDGFYSNRPLKQTGNGLGSGATVTFEVIDGKISPSSVTINNPGNNYLLDDVLVVELNYPTERLINTTYWNPVFMVTAISSGVNNNNLLTASTVINTGAKVDMNIYTIALVARYEKETQIIDGLFRVHRYDSQKNPLSTGYIEIDKYTQYWDNSSTLTSTIKYVPRNGYYKYWNLYRTGAAGTYQLVDKIPIHESVYVDSKSTSYLGQNPTSYYTDVGALGEIDVLFNTPPRDLTGLTEHFGMYFGISGNAVRWTPFGSPDAFPDTFMVTLPYKPLALKSFANSLLILCEDSIYRLEGNKPVEMSLSKSQVEDGCIAPRSVQATSNGLIYLSKRGLMITNGQIARCISEDKLKPNFFTSTSKQNTDFNFWWMPTVGSYFYANLVSNYGYESNRQQVAKFSNIKGFDGINNAIRSFIWNGKYFLYWSNSPNDDFSGHTCICVDFALESMPITTLGVNAIDIITDENDNVYALFANQGDASQENYNEFKSQMRQGIYDPTKFKTNDGLSIWQLFAGDNYIPMTVRTGYKRIESNIIKNGVQQIGNPFDRKVYDYIDFYGNGNVSSRAYIDGDFVVSGNVVMEQSYRKPRRLNFPAGKRIGYNVDIEVFGSTSKIVMEVAYRIPEED